MGAFFRILLIFLLIWVGIKFLFRLLFSWLFVNKMNQQRQNQTNTKREEGEVTILKDKNKKPHHRKEEGEYVDYEEI